MTLKFCQYFVTEVGKWIQKVRTDPVLLEKLGYIAEYEGRTKNRELEQMIKRRIAAFEQEHGEIPIEENDR